MREKIKNFVISNLTYHPVTIDINDIYFKIGLKKVKANQLKFKSWGRWTQYHEKLIDILKNNGYNPNVKEPITINKNNICLDGHHRIEIMLYLGTYKTIEVKKYNNTFIPRAIAYILYKLFYNHIKLNQQ